MRIGRFFAKSNSIVSEKIKRAGREKFLESKRAFSIETGSISEEEFSDTLINGPESGKEKGKRSPKAHGSRKVKLFFTSEDGNSRGDAKKQSPIKPDLHHEAKDDSAHGEAPSTAIAMDKLEEQPSEATHLRKRVGKLPGEIEGHGRILEKIRSLGSLCAPPQKDQGSCSDPQNLVQDCKVVSKQEISAHEHLRPRDVSASILSTLKSANIQKAKKSADNFDILKVIELMRSVTPKKPEDLKKISDPEVPVSDSENGHAIGIVTPKKPEDLKKISDTEVLVSDSENGHTIGIRDLPPTVDLPQVQQALSVFGEVAGTYIKKGKSGTTYTCIKFKSEEAKENALALHWIYVSGVQLQMSRIDPPETSIVRISNIHPDIAKNKILSVCATYGKVARLEPRIEGVVDVYFDTGQLKNMDIILDRLNEIVLSDKRWTAKPAPVFDGSVNHNGQFVRLQKDKLFKDIQKLLQQINMCIEDLNRLDRFGSSFRS